MTENYFRFRLTPDGRWQYRFFANKDVASVYDELQDAKTIVIGYPAPRKGEWNNHIVGFRAMGAILSDIAREESTLDKKYLNALKGELAARSRYVEGFSQRGIYVS